MPKYNTNARAFFVDMDGVCADFESARDESGLDSAEFKLIPGAYRNLKIYPGVRENLLQLIEWGFDVWMATKIPYKNPGAATEKLYWINEHLPFMEKSVIITPNKGTLGGTKDFLIDDRPHKAHCEDFQGKFFRFGKHPDNPYKNWDMVMESMAKRSSDGAIQYDIEVLQGQYIVPVMNHSYRGDIVRYVDVPAKLDSIIRDKLSAYVGFAAKAETVLLASEFVNFLQRNKLL